MAFSNKSVEKFAKYLWNPLFLNDCENHSGCPIGRLSASRTSSNKAIERLQAPQFFEVSR